MRSGDTEYQPQLLALARQRAFGTYLRYGRLSEGAPSGTEQKAIDPLQPLAPAGAPIRPTRHYVWHTIGDERVRSAHALNNGRIFAWANPPQGGHPGTEPNCRCWPVPYFGDPQTPDALQPLTHSHQVDTSGTGGWSSIEMLTRPDGSVAESVVILADGTQVRSAFWRTLIARTVTLTSGGKVRIETDSGVQTVSLGDDKVPLFQSAWTPKGPVVVRTRQRLAFLLERGPFWSDEQIYADPGPTGHNAAAVSAAAQALFGVYAAQQTAPASQGLGAGDEPVVALKAWTVNGEALPVPIFVGSLTEEQLRQHCRFLPDVQHWTDDAAAALADQKPILPARTWGSLVHGAIKRTIDALQASIPFIYDNLHPEISFSPDTIGEVPYGQKGSTRLDVVEDRREDLSAVCNYDVKTGDEGLTLKRLKEIADRLSRNYPGAVIYIVEVRPKP